MIGALAMTQDQSLPLGTAIAGHTIERVLGQGGFGITYRVRNNANGGQAALKEFFPCDDADRLGGMAVRAKPQREDRFDMGRRAFLNEARTLNSLPRQRGLVRIQGAFEKHGTVYALMDFIDGEPLDRAMRIVLSKRPAVPFPLLKDLVESMIGALHTIHNVDVLHRDIKPGNVMIRRDGQPILIDFGAARPIARANSLASMFSRRYAALEQFPTHRTGFRAQAKDGPAIDIFGFSVLLYELVSQSLPPDAEERFKTLNTQGRDPYLPVRDNLIRNRVAHDYPEALLDVIDMGCALFPGDRIKSAEEMTHRLQDVVDAASTIPQEPDEPRARARQRKARMARPQNPSSTAIGLGLTQTQKSDDPRNQRSGAPAMLLIILALAAGGVVYGLLT